MRSVLRWLTVFATVGIVVAMSAEAAAAKGAQVVTITGPGLERPIRLDNLHDQPGVAAPNDLGNATGALLFAAGEANTAIVAQRPAGPLGPRYRVTYRVLVGANRTKPLRQDVYPFAQAGFVVHTPPGQRVFAKEARSGWYVAAPDPTYGRVASDAATAMLVGIGVPRPSPTS